MKGFGVLISCPRLGRLVGLTESWQIYGVYPKIFCQLFDLGTPFPSGCPGMEAVEQYHRTTITKTFICHRNPVGGGVAFKRCFISLAGCPMQTDALIKDKSGGSDAGRGKERERKFPNGFLNHRVTSFFLFSNIKKSHYYYYEPKLGI
ncbi:unknown [Firmicutes bacterium CAG:466]|nr:unknown [Firmicutes bacterium CAG:466]